MYKIKEIEDGKILNFRSLKMQDVTKLCKDINQFFAEGYVLKEDPTPKQCPKIPMLFNLRFEKIEIKERKDGIGETKESAEIKKDEIKDLDEIEFDDDLTDEVTLLEELEELTKKEPLLAFAKKNNIEIPDDKVVASAIKKYIKENLKG